MQLDLATKQDLIDLRNELFKKIDELSEKRTSHKAHLTEAEVLDYLKVSRNTLRKYRIEGYLSPVRIGRKLFYNYNEIMKMLSA